MRTALLLLILVVVAPAVGKAEDDDCASFEQRQSSAAFDYGCSEHCAVAGDDVTPSARLLTALATAGKVGYHADSRLGAAGYARERRVAVGFFGASSEWVKKWQVAGRHVGLCEGLAASLGSLLIDDKNPKDGLNVRELCYRSAEAAARVARVLEQAPDWNYHPFAVLLDGRSVFVIEGRYRAPKSVSRLRAHLEGIPPIIPHSAAGPRAATRK